MHAMHALSSRLRRFALRFSLRLGSVFLLAFPAAAFAAPSDEDLLLPPAPPHAPSDAEMTCCFLAFTALFFLLALLHNALALRSAGRSPSGSASVGERAVVRERLIWMAVGFAVCLFGSVWAGLRV